MLMLLSCYPVCLDHPFEYCLFGLLSECKEKEFRQTIYQGFNGNIAIKQTGKRSPLFKTKKTITHLVPSNIRFLRSSHQNWLRERVLKSDLTLVSAGRNWRGRGRIAVLRLHFPSQVITALRWKTGRNV